MDKDTVIKEIKSAFRGVSLGDGVGLWQGQAIDNYESSEYQIKIREEDEKIDWSLITSDALNSCRSSLSFFDANGMRFHIPAFIIGSLNDEVDDPIFHLTHLVDYSMAQFASFSNLQKKAITVYLNWCLSQKDYEFEHTIIRNAIDKFWKE